MIRVGVIGAAGKMGRAVLAAVAGAEDLELTCVIDPMVEHLEVPPSVLKVTAPGELPDGAADVLVDFTSPDAARAHLPATLRRGFHLVVGTTGLGQGELDELAAISTETGANVLMAANFAIGAILLMRFAAQAAPYFEGVEVIELHHDQKLDAPSGTAIKTVEAIAAARSAAGRGAPHDPTTTEVLNGARGAKGAGGISVHSVRLPGLVAHEEVIFGDPGQGLTIRHDSYDRVSFMAGVLLAIRKIASRPGVTIGLDPLLDS
jgi:4-hydroxy-tetrahydrodipicolinate reductase